MKICLGDLDLLQLHIHCWSQIELGLRLGFIFGSFMSEGALKIGIAPPTWNQDILQHFESQFYVKSGILPYFPPRGGRIRQRTEIWWRISAVQLARPCEKLVKVKLASLWPNFWDCVTPSCTPARASGRRGHAPRPRTLALHSVPNRARPWLWKAFKVRLYMILLKYFFNMTPCEVLFYIYISMYQFFNYTVNCYNNL